METTPRYLPADQLQRLIDVLIDRGFDVIGPTVDQDAIVLRSLQSTDQLPAGLRDHQRPGVYRLEEGRGRFFDFNVGPDSWKRFLFPPRATLANAKLDEDGWHFETPEEPAAKYAFLGVRACDLAAISIQDDVFCRSDFVDPLYAAIRHRALLIAVECTKTADTCFCASMGSGPDCRDGFDLLLRELDDGFVVTAGSDHGRDILSELELPPADEGRQERAAEQTRETTQAIRKRFNPDGVPQLLMEQLEHPHWDRVAERCLSCANCTMVCPTCFCSEVEEVSNLQQTEAERVRHWDSCFNPEMTHSSGGNARPTIRSRYRQWLTHKLSSWHDQFGTSGCIGCGRCITWCPVGIDLTEEVDAIRDSNSRSTHSADPSFHKTREQP
jgi:ferredoxin